MYNVKKDLNRRLNSVRIPAKVITFLFGEVKNFSYICNTQNNKHMKPYHKLSYTEMMALTNEELHTYLFTEEVQKDSAACLTITNRMNMRNYVDIYVNHTDSPFNKNK